MYEQREERRSRDEEILNLYATIRESEERREKNLSHSLSRSVERREGARGTKLSCCTISPPALPSFFPRDGESEKSLLNEIPEDASTQSADPGFRHLSHRIPSLAFDLSFSCAKLREKQERRGNQKNINKERNEKRRSLFSLYTSIFCACSCSF